ncbi:MAG: DoxX family protein [Chlorobi bacterium]|nr:DoxX family protein [Chlorobiota bacterium]
MKQLTQWLDSANSRDTGLLLLRLFAGFALAFAHGYNKVFGDITKFAQGVKEMGFPAPELFATLAGYSEFFGGLMLALGFGTRISTVMIAGTMIVAGFIRHASDPFQARELSLMYLYVATLFFFVGPGQYSIDGMIAKRKRKSQQPTQ